MVARVFFMLLVLLMGCGGQRVDAAPDLRQFAQGHEPWHGDFEAMLERRNIRVLVPYSRTLFFNDGGHERGITAEVARDFERYLNRKYAKRLGRRPLTLFLIPTTRERLLPALNEGLGDIAAGNLTADAKPTHNFA